MVVVARGPNCARWHDMLPKFITLAYEPTKRRPVTRSERDNRAAYGGFGCCFGPCQEHFRKGEDVVVMIQADTEIYHPKCYIAKKGGI